MVGEKKGQGVFEKIAAGNIGMPQMAFTFKGPYLKVIKYIPIFVQRLVLNGKFIKISKKNVL